MKDFRPSSCSVGNSGNSPEPREDVNLALCVCNYTPVIEAEDEKNTPNTHCSIFKLLYSVPREGEMGFLPLKVTKSTTILLQSKLTFQTLKTDNSKVLTE